ncbi:MAG: hypothetical protein Q4G33_07300 [bacterium]|nr:hypothetical protein [bacterium]
MKRKIFITVLTLISVLSIASCGKDDKMSSQITGEGTDIQSTAPADITDTSSASTPSSADSPSAAVTLAPAATPDPDSAQKAQEKVSSNNGETNAVVNDGSGERQVDIKFTLENHTNIDFPALLLAPVTDDISKTANILPDGQTFPAGQSITLNPGDAAQLSTTLFNIAAVDADGKGYVFQNIDLASSSVIQLYIDNGVPKAVIN